MNGKQIIILLGTLAVSALIVRHDLPIEFPGMIGKVLMQFVKMSVVVAVTIFAYLYTGGKKKPS